MHRARLIAAIKATLWEIGGCKAAPRRGADPVDDALMRLDTAVRDSRAAVNRARQTPTQQQRQQQQFDVRRWKAPAKPAAPPREWRQRIQGPLPIGRGVVERDENGVPMLDLTLPPFNYDDGERSERMYPWRGRADRLGERPYRTPAVLTRRPEDFRGFDRANVLWRDDYWWPGAVEPLAPGEVRVQPWETVIRPDPYYAELQRVNAENRARQRFAETYEGSRFKPAPLPVPRLPGPVNPNFHQPTWMERENPIRRR